VRKLATRSGSCGIVALAHIRAEHKHGADPWTSGKIDNVKDASVVYNPTVQARRRTSSMHMAKYDPYDNVPCLPMHAHLLPCRCAAIRVSVTPTWAPSGPPRTSLASAAPRTRPGSPLVRASAGAASFWKQRQQTLLVVMANSVCLGLTFADDVTEAIQDVRNDKTDTNWYAPQASQ